MDNKLTKLVLIGAGVLFFGFLILNFSLGNAINNAVESEASHLLDTDVSASGGAISIIGTSGGLGTVTIGNPEGFNGDYAISMFDIDTDVRLTSVFSDPFIVNSLIVREIDVDYRVGTSGSNLAQLLENLDESSDDNGRDVRIDHFALEETTVNVSINIDELDEEVFSFTISGIEKTGLGDDSSAGIRVAVKEILREILSEVDTQIRDHVIEEGSDQLRDEIEGIIDDLF